MVALGRHRGKGVHAVDVGGRGLADIRLLAERDLPPASSRGREERRDLLDAYTDHVLTFVDADAMRPLTVVADTANGMGGLVVPAVTKRIPENSAGGRLLK